MNKRSIQAAILVIMLLLFNIIGCTEPLADSIAPQPTKVTTKYISAKCIDEDQKNIINTISNVDIVKNENDIVTATYENDNTNQEEPTVEDNSNNEPQQQEESMVNDNVSEQENTNQEEVNYDADGTIAYASTGVDPYPGYYTKYMNLANRMDISVDQMNNLIDHWLNGRESKLSGEGEAFIKASQLTGLDPIFLLALAAQESGWKTSKLHSRKNNPYSIAMYDENPECGYILGDEFGSGIVNGAVWIYDHYYCNGQITLYDMIYGPQEYSSAKDDWIGGITDIMERSYNYILNN